MDVRFYLQIPHLSIPSTFQDHSATPVHLMTRKVLSVLYIVIDGFDYTIFLLGGAYKIDRQWSDIILWIFLVIFYLIKIIIKINLKNVPTNIPKLIILTITKRRSLLIINSKPP